MAYKERLTLDYKKLRTKTGTVEEEWKTLKNYFVGVAEELCDITSGKKGSSSRRKNKLGERKR